MITNKSVIALKKLSDNIRWHAENGTLTPELLKSFSARIDQQIMPGPYFYANPFAPPGIDGMCWEVGNTQSRSRVCMCSSEEDAKKICEALNLLS